MYQTQVLLTALHGRANTKLKLIFPCAIVPGSQCFSHCTPNVNLKSEGDLDIQRIVDQVNRSPFITTFFTLSLSPFLLMGNSIRLRGSRTAPGLWDHNTGKQAFYYFF